MQLDIIGNPFNTLLAILFFLLFEYEIGGLRATDLRKKICRPRIFTIQKIV